jgi:hypothetical protein
MATRSASIYTEISNLDDYLNYGGVKIMFISTFARPEHFFPLSHFSDTPPSFVIHFPAPFFVLHSERTELRSHNGVESLLCLNLDFATSVHCLAGGRLCYRALVVPSAIRSVLWVHQGFQRLP